MIELIDLKEIRYDSQDLADLQALLKQLLGQPFRFFRVSYGDELRLHLGDLRGYSNPRMRSGTRGSYIVAARASSWLVYSVPQLTLATSDDVPPPSPGMPPTAKGVDIKTIETGGFITPGSIVMFASANRSDHGFSLQLTFSDGSTVFIRPIPESHEFVPEGETESEDGGMEISDWEILTPHGRILVAGPGPRWSYLDSAKKRRE